MQLISAFVYVKAGLNKRPEYISSERNPWSSFFVTPLLDNLLSIYNATEADLISCNMGCLNNAYKNVCSEDQEGEILGNSQSSINLPRISLLSCPFEPNGSLSSLMISPESLFPYFYNFVASPTNVGSGLTIGIYFSSFLGLWHMSI